MQIKKNACRKNYNSTNAIKLHDGNNMPKQKKHVATQPGDLMRREPVNVTAQNRRN